MKPFLLLATRAEDTAADEEYEAYLRCGGLDRGQLCRVRLEAGPLPAVDLERYSGIILGGSPFTASDPPEGKSGVQLRVEAELMALVDRVVEADFPFFGACYGIGTLGRIRGGRVDGQFGEPISAVEVELADGAEADPLLADVPRRFKAFVGHKEACSVLPAGAVRLAGSAACPVQMFRVGSNVYATQFHPELDEAGLITRIAVYRNAGYFPPSEADDVVASIRGHDVHVPQRIMANFVRRYAS